MLHGSSLPCGREQTITTMKKNFIYTVTFLLCGAFFFSSCEDMLNVESDRVEYEFDDWTLNDSVYSVLGILKSVQQVGDRQVLLNELRADLLSISEAKAVVDIQELSKSIFNVESNKYLDVKDYYSVINNCNIYLNRVDTTLEKNNVRLMLPEYVAVKSVRAWTYLQLAINYNQVPYFTKPILTHSAAEDVMNQPMLSRNEIITNLIADILPYENPAAYPMPSWDVDGKILKFGYGENGTEVETKQLFVPVRLLLGDLYLWRGAAGDYKKAAQWYYDFITGARTNDDNLKYTDASLSSKYTASGGKSKYLAFGEKFAVKDFANKISPYILTMIPYAKSALEGTVSDLASVFLPQNEVGASQVFASPAMVGLSERQIYRYAEGEDLDRPTLVEYSHNYETKGDLRLLSTTCMQITDDELKTEFRNLVTKFNLEDLGFGGFYVPAIGATHIVIARPEHAYLRFAEAVMGMAREGYDGAMELAMAVLKEGVKRDYVLYQNPVTEDSVYIDNFGNEVVESTVISFSDSLSFDFTDAAFQNNAGIHSHGSGDSERNEYFALDDINVARYFGMTKVEGNVEIIDPAFELTDEHYMLYVSELILDEMALELAWEGTRFGDLMRVAMAIGDPDVLAKRVAGRAYKNTVSHRHPEFEYDRDVYNRMKVETNWYLPLPGEVVEPGKVEETPEDFNPSEVE